MLVGYFHTFETFIQALTNGRGNGATALLNRKIFKQFRFKVILSPLHSRIMVENVCEIYEILAKVSDAKRAAKPFFLEININLWNFILEFGEDLFFVNQG